MKNWFDPEREWNDLEPSTTEVLIEGKRIPYDGMSSKGALEEAIEFYKPDRWEYIGSSDTIWVNGYEQSKSETPYHFFKRKKQ